MKKTLFLRAMLGALLLTILSACTGELFGLTESSLNKSDASGQKFICTAQSAEETKAAQTPLPSEKEEEKDTLLRSQIAAGLFILGAGLVAFNILRRRRSQTRLRRLLNSLGVFLILSAIYTIKFLIVRYVGLSTAEGIVFYFLDFLWFFSLAMLAVRALDSLLWTGLLTEGGKPLVPRIITVAGNVFIFLLVALLFVRFALGQNITAFLITSAGALLAVIAYLSKPITDSAIAGFGLDASEIEKGDHVQIGDVVGVVHDIDSQRVILLSDDENFVFLPNTEVHARTLTNFSRPLPFLKLEVTITLEYEVTVNKARKLIESALNDLDEKIIKYNIYIKEMSAFGIVYGIQYWRRYDALFQSQTAILSALYYKVQKEPNVDFGYDKFDATNNSNLSSEKNTAHLEFGRMAKRALELAVPLLRSVEIFASLEKSDLDELASYCTPRVFGPPEKIIKQGDPGDSMFVVVEGKAKVYLQQHEDLIEIATDGPGQYFGEMALLTGKTRGATVKASEDISLLEIPKEGLRKILQRRPELVKAISEAIAKRQAQNQAIKSQADAKASLTAEQSRTLADSIRAGILHFFGLKEHHEA